MLPCSNPPGGPTVSAHPVSGDRKTAGLVSWVPGKTQHMGPRDGWSDHALQYSGAILKVACTLTQGKSSGWPAEDDQREMDKQGRRERQTMTPWAPTLSWMPFPFLELKNLRFRKALEETLAGSRGASNLKPSDYLQSHALHLGNRD